MAKYIMWMEKNVILDYSEEEFEIAEWLENTFGGKIYMLPRVNIPEGIKTADYLFDGEYWDLKKIFGNGKHCIDSSIKKKCNQAHNFIIDISESKISYNQALNQIKRIYENKDRTWINRIILKDSGNVTIITRKKD